MKVAILKLWKNTIKRLIAFTTHTIEVHVFDKFRTTLFIFFFIIPLSSEEEIKLNILAKYTLDEFELKVIDDARIFSEEKDQSLEKGIYKVKIQNEDLELYNDTTSFNGKQILFRCQSQFIISFRHQGEYLYRTYKGELELFPERKNIMLVLKLPLEDYVNSATYSELGILLTDKHSTQEAKTELISAQEIVVRTYTKNERNRHSDKRFSFCDLTHCMNFKGYTNKNPLQPGKVITGNSAVSGYFHSTCGGILSGPEVFWSSHHFSTHYKRGADGNEIHCKGSPQFYWETFFSESELEIILEEKNIVSINTELQNNRVRSLEFIGKSGERKKILIATLTSKVGKLYGWNKIKSNFFQLEKVANGYMFQGRGFGHGIGLCQWGAKYLADTGKSHEEILQFYFPGTKIKLFKKQ